LQSGVGTVGPVTAPSIRYLSSRYANPLGGGIGDWKSSAESYPQQPAQPQESGGLPDLIRENMRNNAASSR